MNIENIELGVIYKNLRELCNVLNLQYKDSTDSRKAIVKHIETYMELERKGNRYTVTKVYDVPATKIDGRGKAQGSRSNNSVYVNYIDILVKDVLLNSLEDKEYFYTSNNGILSSITITEDTFIEQLNEVDKHSYINAKLKLLSTLNNMVTSSLKRLQRQCYIKLREGYLIIDSNTTRLADKKETALIDTIRDQLLKELDIKPVQLLLNKSIRYKFYTNLKERLIEQADDLEALQFVFKGYKIQSNTKPLSTNTKAEIDANRQQIRGLISQRVFKDI